MEQPPPVALRPIDWITPTLAETLQRCMLSAAFRADPAYVEMRRPSIPAVLGTVSHKLAERVARGEFDDRSDGDQSLSHAWDELIDQARTSLEALTEFGPVPEPAHWPGYQLIRVRTLRRLEEELASRRRGVPGRKASLVPEERLKDPATHLAGTPDRVEIVSDRVEVVDLKTGWRVGDELSEAHRRQLLLYAFLWNTTHDRWPDLVSVQRLDGTRVSIPVDPAEAIAEADAAGRLLSRYNALVCSPETTPETLAHPSEPTCRGCSFRGACDPFLRAPSSGWFGKRRTFAGELSSIENHPDRAVMEMTNVVGGTDAVTVRVVSPPDPFGLQVHDRCVLVDAIPVTEQDFRVDWVTRLIHLHQ